jgi:hypothetical protein
VKFSPLAKVKFLQSELFRYAKSEVCPMGKLWLLLNMTTTFARCKNFTALKAQLHCILIQLHFAFAKLHRFKSEANYKHVY